MMMITFLVCEITLQLWKSINISEYCLNEWNISSLINCIGKI